MSRLWHSYLRSRLIFQAVVSILVVTLLTIVFVALAIIGTSGASATALLGDLLFGNPKIDVSSTLKSAYHVSLLLVLAVWQAVFLARLLTRPHDFRFSKHAAFYPFNPLQGEGSKPLIVFRLLNEGSADLYNVEIDVTLRVFNPHTSVFQHFRCSVRNHKIPVFRQRMPFWIAIEVGETSIKSDEDSEPLDRCFLLEKPQVADADVRLINQEYSAAICGEHALPAEAFCLIVYVRGHDLEMDQEKAGVAKFAIADIKRGFFRSIAPARQQKARPGAEPKFFDAEEINRNFDVVEPIETVESLPPREPAQHAIEIVPPAEPPEAPAQGAA